MTMQQPDYADPKLVDRYLGIDLTDEDKKRVDDAVVPVPELIERPELVLYATGQALSAVITGLFSKVEEILGEEATIELARSYGREHGELNLGKFLRNRNLPGGPESFAMYQDWGHALRGPRHAVALFSYFDDDSVMVRRSDCVYFCGERGTPNKYIANLEGGIVEGYQVVDPSLTHFENEKCLCKGSTDGCEHRWYFKQQ
jgi:hypothetical protein